METKYVRVPFEVELAKKITNGEVYGKIVTRDGRSVRIICFDAHCEDNIVALVDDSLGLESTFNYLNNGKFCIGDEKECDLFIEIPEYMTFKDGDVATLGWHGEDGEYCEWITILKSVEADEINILTEDYVTVCLKCDEENYFPIDFDCTSDGAKWIRKPTEPERQKLIDELKSSKEPKAKECLKMLGLKVEPECQFNPKDWVLCKGSYSSIWTLCRFSHIEDNISSRYISVGGNCWNQCIPYNEQTAHLLGTTENYE